MKKSKRQNINLNSNMNYIHLPNEEVQKILMDNYYQKLMQEVDNIDVDINHLENIFTDDIYFQAMKIIPLIERKILYLSYIENNKLNDICRKLKLQKNEVIFLRNKAINHFKHNLNVLYKTKNLKKDNK